MAIKQSSHSFLLEAEQIDLVSQQVFDFLGQLKLESREVTRIRLNVENILLAWQARFGADGMVRLSCYVRLGQPIIRLQLEGEPFDPLEAEEDDFGRWKNALLANMETQAAYSYVRGANLVVFRIVKPKRSPLVLLVVSLAAAVVVGLAGVMLPGNVREIVAGNYIAPIADAYLNVLGFFGIPLIFLSVALGIRGIDDAHLFDRIGKRMVGFYFVVLLILTLLAGGVAAPFFRFVSGDSLNIVYTELLGMVLGWLPTNLIKPFVDCNAMQLVLMGFIFGIGLLKLEPQTKELSGTLESLKRLLLWGAEGFARLIPLFVFAIVVKSFWLGQMSEILPAWKSWVITTGLQAAALLLMMLAVCRKYRVGLYLLMKKISETFLISLGTNSCTASIPENYACCAGKLGIAWQVFGFGIPIGTSIFKPASAIRLIVLSFYMASAYEVGVSAQWFVMAVLMAVIFSIAVPAIPGGTLMFCPMLFVQLGLPAEALTPMLATDIFFDAVCTAFNQVSVQIALVHQAGSLDLLDLEMLRRAEP